MTSRVRLPTSDIPHSVRLSAEVRRASPCRTPAAPLPLCSALAISGCRPTDLADRPGVSGRKWRCGEMP
ncbi:hypothetical protein [Azospirillum palustre]